MFSYRHAFHAGNHADVLKHIVLLECLNLMMQKETGLMLIDTHAGAGIYELEDGYASVSGESLYGISKLKEYVKNQASAPHLVEQYLNTIEKFNRQYHNTSTLYPGSPALIAEALRPVDKLRLFELHPTDIPLLEENINQLHVGRQTQILAKDGFDGLKAFLPPPTRRGLALIDPSYEDKNDYHRLNEVIEDALKRFATGTYAIWYPHLSRIDSQEVPKKLKQIEVAGKPISWLHVMLQVKSPTEGSGLYASGMFIINPPWKLKVALEEAMEYIRDALAQDESAHFVLESYIP
jgi:23S rRNA (adenine2030-N6)-methyltransferase